MNKLISSTPNLRILPHISDCAKTDFEGHLLHVHDAHMKVLQKCIQQHIAPCLVLEADAVWNGDLADGIQKALNENTKTGWDLFLMGITPEDIVSFNSVGRQWRPKKHSLRIRKTGGGCHAYMVQNPLRFYNFFLKRSLRLFTGQKYDYVPCVEFISNKAMRMFIATDVPVIQYEKSYREGIAWNKTSLIRQIKEKHIKRISYET